MAQEKLYRCCNTCKHKANILYGCNIPKECFNGFSAYEPNKEMAKQEQQVAREWPGLAGVIKPLGQLRKLQDAISNLEEVISELENIE